MLTKWEFTRLGIKSDFYKIEDVKEAVEELMKRIEKKFGEMLKYHYSDKISDHADMPIHKSDFLYFQSEIKEEIKKHFEALNLSSTEETFTKETEKEEKK